MDRGRVLRLIDIVAVVMVVVLICLILPSVVQSPRVAARRMQCGNHVRQLSLALLNYHDVNLAFPSGAFRGNCGYKMGWVVRVFPYMEQGPRFDSINPVLLTATPWPLFHVRKLESQGGDSPLGQCGGNGLHERV